jgi:hypothetical protein
VLHRLNGSPLAGETRVSRQVLGVNFLVLDDRFHILPSPSIDRVPSHKSQR